MLQNEIKKKSILVVDDEPEILELMEGWLTHLDYDVLTANNGDDALWYIKSKKPDLVILDMLIPGLTGSQVLEKLRSQNEEVQKIPVIVMSARESMRDISEDIFAFVGKPFDPKQMIATIKRALERSSYEGNRS